MKRILTTILLSTAYILISLSVNAQSAAEQARIIAEINKISSETKSIQCDFTQTKHLTILSEEMTSKGSMYFSQADKLRWEYKQPYQYIFILNGNEVTLRNNERTDVIDIQQNKLFREIARIMMNSIMGNCLSDTNSFRTGISENENEWIADLTPLKKEMKQMWSKMEIHFDRKSQCVSMVKMYEHNGDYTTITLHNVKKNREIAPDIFTVR